jgi:hypothetical protein
MSRTKDHVIDTITTWDDAIDGPLPAWLHGDRPTPCRPAQADRPHASPTSPPIRVHDQQVVSPPSGGDGAAAMR